MFDTVVGRYFLFIYIPLFSSALLSVAIEKHPEQKKTAYCNNMGPSVRHHLSYDDCLEDKRENYQETGWEERLRK